MIYRPVLAAAFLSFATACAEPEVPPQSDEAAPEAPASEAAPASDGEHNSVPSPEEVSDASPATSFITPGHSVSDSAQRGDDGVPRDEAGRPYDYLYLGRELPAFSGTMVSGPLFSTQELKNQWTLIEVWGVWCHDSRKDAPYVQSLWEEVKGSDDLAFLSVHVPQNAERADRAYGDYGSVEAFFEEKGYSWPVLTDPDASIRETLGIKWTPSYILVAPDLTVQGFRTELAASPDDDPVAGLLQEIEAVKASYDPDADRPVED